MNRTLFLLFMTGMSFLSQAQIHTHGQGYAFIAQQDKQWVINIVLPAKDIIGFEHAPQTKQQRTIVEEFKASTKVANRFVTLHADCKQVSVDVAMPSQESDSHNDQHDAHHGNIEIKLEYSCQAQIKGVSFPMLKSYSSLESLSVEWITQTGQGAKKITHSANSVTLQ